MNPLPDGPQSPRQPKPRPPRRRFSGAITAAILFAIAAAGPAPALPIIATSGQVDGGPTPIAPAQPAGALQSSSRSFKIVDDGDPRDAVLVEDLNPDIYVAHPALRIRTVSVVTDQGRLDFALAPGQTVDFDILWNGRRYPQRITDVAPDGPLYAGAASLAGGVDIIPFRLGPNNGIHLQGTVNDSRPVDLIFDTGASIGVVAEGAAEKGARIAEGRANTLSIGSITVSRLPLIAIAYRGTLRSDGVIGYDAFAGKVVEIDYGASVLRIHHDRPDVSGFARERLVWRESRTLVPLTVGSGSSAQSILAILDTGSKFSLSLGFREPIAAELRDLRAIGSRTGVRADGRRVRSRVVSVPSLALAGVELDNVQVDVEAPSAETGLPYNISGNDYLRRFDLIIDYRASEVFVRPNAAAGDPYNRAFPLSLGAAAGILCVAGACSGGLALMVRSGARRKAVRLEADV